MDGDGKISPEEELETLMILKQASKHSSSSGGGPGGENKGGCIWVIVIIIFVVIIIIAALDNCLGCTTRRYNSKRDSYSSSYNASHNGTSERNNNVTQTPGLSHSVFEEGKYVTNEQLEMMEWQGVDGKKESVRTTKYRYDIGDYIYIIWVSDSNRIMKVSTTITGKTSIDMQKNNKKNNTSAEKSEYELDDFANAEDFYDWYKDDFVDFEEAEDYYEEHGGE